VLDKNKKCDIITFVNKIKIKAENAEYQIIQSLKLNRIKRNKSGEIFIEGIECIKQAIKSDTEITRIITKDVKKLSNWGKGVIEKYADVKIIEMSDKLYNDLSDKTDPSEMLVTAKVKHISINDIQTQNPFLIVFDRPSDHGNFGSIIRSANAFNADGIFIIGHGIDMYDSKVIRASLGSVFFTKIAAVESMEVFLEYVKTQKKENNMEVIGTDSAGTVSAEDYKIKRPLMVIIGNEAKGMSQNLQEICDKIIRIPIQGNVNSLNVSCAASIIMWEVFKNLH
jgi:TrmH family RNA methyltransferase